MSLKSCEKFSDEIVNEEKNINEEIFRNYFKYQNPSPLAKNWFKADKNKIDKIKYIVINELVRLMEDINIKNEIIITTVNVLIYYKTL